MNATSTTQPGLRAPDQACPAQAAAPRESARPCGVMAAPQRAARTSAPQAVQEAMQETMQKALQEAPRTAAPMAAAPAAAQAAVQMATQTATQMAMRQQQLQQVAAELKAELFGIDEVIDRVINAVRAWWVLPQLITRPAIVCLWGLTGTGKTQLVRRLAQKLGFYDRFVQVQMDGFSHGASHRSAGSIAAMLARSGIAEGEPGVLLLDEFQRYRTIDSKRRDIKVARYQDVWTLLSDGRLAPMLSFIDDLEFTAAQMQFDAAKKAADDSSAAPAAARQPFQLDAWDAQDLKTTLKLSEPLTAIMAWTPEQVQARLQAFRSESERWETDYSRLLIFITGNLDEMYDDMAERVQDCDTDADVFHAMSRKLSVIDVKKALGKRFRPEQVARLGNHHVIYPSLNRAAYQRLIAHTAQGYVDQVQARCGLRFDIAQPVLDAIYDNAVYPAQGTRPVFSTVHAVLGSPLVDAALWALERGAPAGASLPITLGSQGGQPALALQWQAQQHSLPVPLELGALRQRASPDFRALLAVHEAGHGLVFALLLGQAPQEVRINVASFEGGYNSYVPRQAWSRRMWLNRICTTLAGRAAETLVFGPDAVTTGAEQDYENATQDAARAMRHFGFGARTSRTDVSSQKDEDLNTDIAPTNTQIEALLTAELARAQALLQEHRAAFCALVEHLLAHGNVPAADFARITGLNAPPAPPQGGLLEPWHQQWQSFAQASAQPACA